MYLSFSTVARRVFSSWMPLALPPRTDDDVERCSSGSPPTALAMLPALASLSGGRQEPLRSMAPVGVGGRPEERRSSDAYALMRRRSSPAPRRPAAAGAGGGGGSAGAGRRPHRRRN
jgi:hypothetical protein